MSDRVLRSHTKRARQNLKMATGQKDMPDQGQNQAMYVLPWGLSMPMANLTPKIIRFCEEERFKTLKGKKERDFNSQMMDREAELRLEIMHKCYKLDGQLQKLKFNEQVLKLETEQVLGQSISEDIIQELEKEIANAKLADDSVRDKPIGDFILLKQTGEYCSMLKELERAVDELKSDEANQVQRLCKQVDHMKKCQDRHVLKQTKRVVNQSNGNPVQIKAKEVKPECEKFMLQSTQVTESKIVEKQVPSIRSCDSSQNVQVTEIKPSDEKQAKIKQTKQTVESKPHVGKDLDKKITENVESQSSNESVSIEVGPTKQEPCQTKTFAQVVQEPVPKILPSKKGVTKTHSKSPPAYSKQCAKKKPLVTKKTRSQTKCENFTDDHEFRPVGRKKAAKVQLVHETNQGSSTYNSYEGLEVQSIPDQGQEYDGNYKWHSRTKPRAKKKQGKHQNRKVSSQSLRFNAVSQIQPVKSSIHDKPKVLRQSHENVHVKCESEITKRKSHPELDFSHRPTSHSHESSVKKQPHAVQSVKEFCGTGVRMRGSNEINSCDQKEDPDPETQFPDHTIRPTNHTPRNIQTCDAISESVSQIQKSEMYKFLPKHGKVFCNLSAASQPNVITNDILNKKAQKKLNVLKQKVKMKTKSYLVKILPNSKLEVEHLAKV